MNHWRTAAAVGAALGLVAAACTPTTGVGGAEEASPSASAQETADGVVGPLCPMLPSGDEPGNPTFLQELPPGEALTWIPVATNFEAAVRAAELDLGGELTILVPSDDTFDAAFSEDTIDELLLERTDDLRALLEAHIVTDALSLAELAEHGSVTTTAGTSVAVTGSGANLRLDEDATVLCGDYRASGARIHVIDAVLGPLPEPAADEEDAH